MIDTTKLDASLAKIEDLIRDLKSRGSPIDTAEQEEVIRKTREFFAEIKNQESTGAPIRPDVEKLEEMVKGLQEINHHLKRYQLPSNPSGHDLHSSQPSPAPQNGGAPIVSPIAARIRNVFRAGLIATALGLALIFGVEVRTKVLILFTAAALVVSGILYPITCYMIGYTGSIGGIEYRSLNPGRFWLGLFTYTVVGIIVVCMFLLALYFMYGKVPA